MTHTKILVPVLAGLLLVPHGCAPAADTPAAATGSSGASCPVACAATEVCVGVSCQCLAQLTPCAAGCVDTQADAANCGACGASCAPGRVCSFGMCTTSCAPGLAQCVASCVNHQTDVLHCGVCNNACPAGTSCSAGSCVPVAGVGGGGAGGMNSGGRGGSAAGGSAAGGSAAGAGGATGGASGAGTGGASGAGATSGTAGVSGTSGTAGTTGSAGTGGGATGGCATPPASACSSPQVRVTEVNLGVTVIGSGGEGDTQPLPMAIAPIPAGGSRLAWLSNNDRVYVAELDCDDQLVGTPFSLPANDFQDIAADAGGGVIALTRDAQGGGTLNCGNPSNLCDGGPSPAIPCYDMYLVRFDNSGNESWATKLTTSSASLPPYSTGPTGATVHMIWWYQHHTRIASDGTNYAAYFCDAISISEGGCINIHEGDRMQVVGPSGALVNHPDAFPGGCSHSWNTRIVWDDRTGNFVMVCATDFQNQVARPAPYRTILSTPDIGTLSVGNLVLASGQGYWVSVSYQGTIRLLHFNEAAPDRNITVGSSNFSHLASYGPNRLLIAWESESTMTAQVRDAGDGSAVSSQFSINVPDHRYQDMKGFPDGSVAYPAQGSNSQSIRVARVLPCSG